MKVLFITHNYIRFKGDFAGVFLHLLARKLKEEEIEVTVVAPHDAGAEEYEEIDGIRVYRFRYAADDDETFAYRGDMHRRLFRNPFRLFGLIKFIRSAYHLACETIEKENINVVSVQWLIPNGVVGYFLKRKYKDSLTLYISSHGTDIRLLTNVPLVYSLFRPVISVADRWTVVSNFLKERLLGKDKKLQKKLIVIPLPNDETLFYPDPKVEKDQYLVVAVSRLTIQKRIPYLLEAIKTVSAVIPEIRLEIYGAGPEKLTLDDLIEEMGLIGRVRILNPLPQEELRRVYNRATVVVLNSIKEGFGLALTEAMLCKTAVVGTASGGIPDIIDNGETGLLVTLDNSGELAVAINSILRDKEMRERLAEAGYQKAIKQFSAEASAGQFAALFRGEIK